LETKGRKVIVSVGEEIGTAAGDRRDWEQEVTPGVDADGLKKIR
jgi:hypothetical protein